MQFWFCAIPGESSFCAIPVQCKSGEKCSLCNSWTVLVHHILYTKGAPTPGKELRKLPENFSFPSQLTRRECVLGGRKMEGNKKFSGRFLVVFRKFSSVHAGVGAP